MDEQLRQAVWRIYDLVQEELYLNRPDMEVKGVRLNAALIMSLLTALSQGKQLIVGEPGLGKTTSAEYICSLLFRFPLGTVWRSEISGHPEQTEEKIIGRPDLGKLNRGEEAVIWSCFTLLPTKIVDEINRLPETKQSMILDGVDRGKWEYLNEAVVNREFCLFATANYQDRGTHTIISPLIDRFDVMVESKYPGANLAYHIGTRRSNGPILRDENLEKLFYDVLTSTSPYHTRMDEMEALCRRFGSVVEKKLGLKTLSWEQRQTIRAEKENIPFDLDSNAFLRLVLSELSFCHRFGQKRSHEDCDEGCHFTNYFCSAVKNCISNRLPISVRGYAQTLAWLLGDKQVELDHLKGILPFALAHRIQWKEEALARWDSEVRNDPLDIYMAKKALREMHRRYVEQSEQVKEALSLASRIAEGETAEPIRGDHPIYWEILKDLGEEIAEE